MYEFNKSLVVAVDGMSPDEINTLCDCLGAKAEETGQNIWVKMHDQIDDRGMAAVEEARESSVGRVGVWADLKLFDIPTTVVNRIARLEGADAVSVHLLGGVDMVKASSDAAHERDMLLVGITHLTSAKMDDPSMMVPAINLIAVALDLGRNQLVDALVGDPETLRRYGWEGPVIRPGVRPLGYSSHDDHTNPLTPTQAIRSGATAVVIGRPITKAPDKDFAIQEVLNEIRNA